VRLSACIPSIHPSIHPSLGLELTRPTASNPPPRELKVSDPAVRDLTLAELGLAPSSVLQLRFVDDGLNRAFLFPGPPLLPVEAAAPCLRNGLD
jgi:hypothetical protein